MNTSNILSMFALFNKKRERERQKIFSDLIQTPIRVYFLIRIRLSVYVHAFRYTRFSCRIKKYKSIS